jgi:hypothetical protein
MHCGNNISRNGQEEYYTESLSAYRKNSRFKNFATFAALRETSFSFELSAPV